MKKSVAQNSEKYIREEIIQGVLDLLNVDDGKTFAEKKESILNYIEDWANGPHTDTVEVLAKEEQLGEAINQKFWEKGQEISVGNGITMRRVQPSDCEGYFAIQRAYLVTAPMLKEPTYRDMLWEEHISPKRLTLTILHQGSYIGYCGINNLLKEVWEIGIELCPEWTGQGIGYSTVSKMLEEIQKRLGKDTFTVRIEPRNIASQKLFEKMGAVPDGIAANWTENQMMILQCEEDNLNQIDEELIGIAQKFDVPPRKLLSHVLKYSLKL